MRLSTPMFAVLLAACAAMAPFAPVLAGDARGVVYDETRQAVVAPRPDAAPRLRVNQLGYLSDGPKAATLVTDATTPLGWRLRDAADRVVASGMTTPRGVDPSAGLNVQTLDFSGVTATGEGFTLAADGTVSHRFAIGAGLYDDLARDALAFFYPMRSGIAVDGAVAGAAYARPAGHLSRAGSGGINQGDRNVPCQEAEASRAVYDTAWSCAYRLDVTGGWYDGGDQGKYVVNGAVAAAQLLAAYEHGAGKSGAAPAAFGDGGLVGPDGGNGVPDILDEARWELEWLLKMMVPAGKANAGMVHHKVQDAAWTALPMLPSNDPERRELHRPSTAATLDLAAVAAMGARVYRPFDPAFAARLADAAETAYAAALAYPNLNAPMSDGDSGGRAYADTDIADELYWASAELYITTGTESYHTALKTSPYWTGQAFAPYAFDWRRVAGFARIALAMVPNGLPKAEHAAIVDSVVAAAGTLLAAEGHEPFGQPYAPSDNDYARGSNRVILDNALVIAAAYRLTGDDRYRDGAIGAMDYILGRNALGISYVTGYGTRFADNQYSRWFARQLDPDLPPPPNGTLASGSNSGIEDPLARQLFGTDGCAPQACYVDDIHSWSTNAVGIGQNAALVQMAVFLAGL